MLNVNILRFFQVDFIKIFKFTKIVYKLEEFNKIKS